MLMCKDFVVRWNVDGLAAKVSLFRWYISRWMVSERVCRQAHGILKVFSFGAQPTVRFTALG